MAVTYSKCLDCERPMVSWHNFRRMDERERAALKLGGGTFHKQRGLCSACVGRRRRRSAELPPKISDGGRRTMPTECTVCGFELVRKDEWQTMTIPQKQEARANGRNLHQGHGWCARCYHRGGKPRVQLRLEEVIEESEHLFEAGTSVDEVANRLGIKRNTLADAFLRGRRKGLTQRQVPWERKTA